MWETFDSSYHWSRPLQIYKYTDVAIESGLTAAVQQSPTKTKNNLIAVSVADFRTVDDNEAKNTREDNVRM